MATEDVRASVDRPTSSRRKLEIGSNNNNNNDSIDNSDNNNNNTGSSGNYTQETNHEASTHLLGRTRTMRYVTADEMKEWIHCP